MSGGGGGVAGASSLPLDCGASVYFLVPWVAPPPLGLMFPLISPVFLSLNVAPQSRLVPFSAFILALGC